VHEELKIKLDALHPVVEILDAPKETGNSVKFL